MVVRKKRLLPIPGRLKVKIGDIVKANDIVAETELPGKVHSVNVANRMGVSAREMLEFLKVKQGDQVKAGQVLAENKPFISWFKTSVECPVNATVETISEVTGQLLLREAPKVLALPAYVDGKIVEVFDKFGVTVETEGAFIQGIFGVGGEANGEIAVAVASPDEELLPEDLLDTHKGKIVIGGNHAGWDAIQKAKTIGVSALVVGGIHDKDLRQLLGYDIGVAITGHEQIGLTLIITEGFGMIPMAEHTFKLLKEREGQKASISGATQIRAGVMRPEIIVPGVPANVSICREDLRGATKPGDPVRIIREPHFGQIGKVTALPSELVKIPSESHVRVMEVEMPGGEKLIIPRSNVELLEK